MNLLLIASEIGSVRAILPLAPVAEAHDSKVILAATGSMPAEAAVLGKTCTVLPDSPEELERFLADQAVSAVVFSVNVHDPAPLRVARAAAAQRIPTIHVLDYWNGYAERLTLDGKPMFLPTAYAVPDMHARREALRCGIPDAIISVTGHAGFADLRNAFLASADSGRSQPFETFGLAADRTTVLFVSEPVAHDQGRSLADSPMFRGYTEETVIPLFVNAINAWPGEAQIIFLPHPREDRDALSRTVTGAGLRAPWTVATDIRGRDLLPYASGVAGMASTLLFEAWLCGIPVISMQPGLRNPSLRIMEGRDNAAFIDSPDTFVPTLAHWLESIGPCGQRRTFRPELHDHENAAELLHKTVKALAGHH